MNHHTPDSTTAQRKEEAVAYSDAPSDIPPVMANMAILIADDSRRVVVRVIVVRYGTYNGMHDRARPAMAL